MEIKITTPQLLKVLQLLSWIVFIGLCVEAGEIIVNAVITLTIHPPGVANFWEGAAYLSGLYSFDKGYFMVIVLIMSIVAVLKALMFYLIVKLFSERKLNISHPFNPELRKFILDLSCITLGISLFSHAGVKYATWLAKQGGSIPDLQALHFVGADIWLFMAIVLFVIVQVVKRGIELQTENDLTI